MVELLAPAGSFEALVAAVENGANAVYLAGSSFGARAYAENFTPEVMRNAIKFAHLRGVAVHVTVNTIVDDSELDKLADYLRFLYESGVDAILVQDLGVAYLAKKIIPDMPLHASTQMTVHNLDGVKALEKLGFERVVLSREVSLKDIRYICANCKAQIEVFIHGALCVCYSGQCLMSSMIGGRSGNRGRCAQPCRLPYKLVTKSGKDVLGGNAGEYLLSPRDLNTIDLLPELIEAGVYSLKIEGRMKRPEYVGTVVDVYRRAIDNIFNENGYAVSAEDKRRLAQIFNRDFTTAYLQKRQGKNMMSDRRPNNRGLLIGRVVKFDRNKNHVTLKLNENVKIGDEIDFWVKVGGRVTAVLKDMVNSQGKSIETAFAGETVSFPINGTVHEHDRVFRVYDAQLMERVKQTYNSGAPIRRIDVRLSAVAEIGKPLLLKVLSADGYEAEVISSFIAEKAQKRPLTKEMLTKQLDRIGNTVYHITELSLQISDDVMIPISEINNTRRRLFDLLDDKRLAKYSRMPLIDLPVYRIDTKKAVNKNVMPKIIVNTDNIETVQAAIDAGADGILFGGDSYTHNVLTIKDYRKAQELAVKNNCLIYFNTPRIVRENSIKTFKALAKDFAECEPDGINIHNISMLEIFKEYPELNLQADFSLITYNSLTLQMLKELNIKKAVLSPELSMAQIEGISCRAALPLECIVHGRLELMVSEYCVTGSFLGNIAEGPCNHPCKNNNYFLQDRKNEQFPLVMDQDCHMHILNAKTLSMLPAAMKFRQLGIDSIRIDAKYLTAEETAVLTSSYKKYMYHDDELTIDEKEECRKIEGNDITRGHYFRGVL